MRRTGLAAGVAALAFALGGCASGIPGSAKTQVPVDANAGEGFAGGSVGDATEPIIGPVFPLTLHRTGGIAGYDDVIVLQADGRVNVDTRSIRGRECRLTTDQQKQMLSLLGTLRLVGGQSAGSDGSEPGVSSAPRGLRLSHTPAARPAACAPPTSAWRS